jgi:GNAT superfamily N-acetyltransferase
MLACVALVGTRQRERRRSQHLPKTAERTLILAGMAHHIEIVRLSILGEAEVAGLSEVLSDCVEGGASVSFMLPMPKEKAAAYWRSLAPAVTREECLVLAARADTGALLGTVTLLLKQPENQPHRADLAKMLVHRRARRAGLGEARLLAAAEEAALRAGRTPGARYRGCRRHGSSACAGSWSEQPGPCTWPQGEGATTVFYKKLSADPRVS